MQLLNPNKTYTLANVYQSTISVYKPGTTSPSLTIKEGLNAPIALTLNAP